MCYELLMGQTPFHSFEMNELLDKINKGIYTVHTKDPVSVQCALFLTQCLQANESDRINMAELMEHPFVVEPKEGGENMETKLTVLKPDVFIKD